MSERRAAGLLTAGFLMAGCSSEAEPMNMPKLEEMQVACVNVEGFPEYSQAGCDEAAKKVEAGFDLLSTLTNGQMKKVKVTTKMYPELIKVDDAVERRCVNFNAKPQNIEPIEELVAVVAKTALDRIVDVDFNKTGVFLAVNAPQSMCSKDRSSGPIVQGVKGVSEQCPKGAAAEKPHYGDGRALIEYGKPLIIGFGIESKKDGADLFIHEKLHFGQETIRLGHEVAFCSEDSQKVPNHFGNSPGSVKIDQHSDRLSIMGGTLHGANYIAPPHLHYIDAIEQNRVYKPTQDTSMVLKDVSEKEGIALLQLKLENAAIRAIIGKNLSGFTKKVKAEDFVTFIGKMPGEQKVGVYVAPKKEDGSKDTLPIFLVDVLLPGEDIAFDGDFKMKVDSGNGNQEIKVDLKFN